MSALRWGILATGGIARTFARDLAGSAMGVLAAVASREQGNAERFVAALPSSPAATPVRAYGSYTALLADPGIDAVYLAMPHPGHAASAIAACAARKHVLIEKPLAMQPSDGEAIFAAARAHRVFAMEAFMYRCHPQTARVLDLVRRGAIGQVSRIDAVFSFRADVPPEHRLVAPALGGGGIRDVGCYAMSLARRVAGEAFGLAQAAEPVALHAVGARHPAGCDAWSDALLRFAHHDHVIAAHLACGVALEDQREARIVGSDGLLRIPEPFVPSPQAHIILHRRGSAPERIACPGPALYRGEADHVAACIAAGLSESPCMPWADSLGNLRALTSWLEAQAAAS